MLLLSILALLVGPLLYHSLQRGGRIAAALERAILVFLLVLVVFVLLPELWHETGAWSLLYLAVGYLLPGALETVIKRAAETLHVISLMLALLGLVLHAMLDGAGIAADPEGLALAIVLHRLGMGLVVWLLVQPAFGRRAAWAVLGVVAVATVAGWALSDVLSGLTGGRVLPVIEGLIVGMIVHSLVHRGHLPERGHRHA